MKVEEIAVIREHSTFSDVKKQNELAHFSHRISFDYTDFTDVTNALTKTLNPELFKNSSGTAKGLLDGMVVRDVILNIKTAFTGLSNIQTNGTGAVIDFGVTGDIDKFIDAQDMAASTVSSPPLYRAYATSGDGDAYGYITIADLNLTLTLTCAVSSGSDKLNALTAGEAEIYMEIVNMNDVIADKGWRKVTL